MARPPLDFVRLSREFVCVRVTNMRDVDLGRYRFDYDLTFAVLLMHPNGAVYHRYGSRDHRDPMSHTSMVSLLRVMQQTLEEHRRGSPPAPEPAPPTTILDRPGFVARQKGKPVECVHCHTLHDVEVDEAREQGTWSRDRIWIYPEPTALGLRLDRDDPTRVIEVQPDGPAGVAGVVVGDHLQRAAGQSIASRADLQWVLHHLPGDATEVALEVERAGEVHGCTVELAGGWKQTDALRYSWRSLKWNLTPAPGFGGPVLDEVERRRLGLESPFAFRVNYIVTWGPRSRTGRNAAQAGIRTGDVILSVDGKDDFRTMDHFHSWFRLTREVGQTATVVLLRGGQRREVALPVIP